MKIKEFKGNHILSTVIIAFLCVSTVFTVMFMYAKRENRKELEKAATTQEIQISTSEQLNPNIKSGTIGDNIYWKSNFETSTLTLRGSGIISGTIDYSELSKEERERLSNLVIENGISGFDNKSQKADDLYTNFNSISYPDSFTDGIISGKVETHVSKNNPNYSTDSCGVLYNKDKTELISFPEYSPFKEFKVPDRVKSVAASAFVNCRNLNSLILPDGLEYISSNSFSDSYLFEDENNWVDGVLYVSNCLICANDDFSGTLSVKSGTRVIASSAFIFNEKLTEVIIPDSVTSICNGAFSRCTELKTVRIGKGLKKIGNNVFSDIYAGGEMITCRSLEKIEVSDDNRYFSSEDGVLFNKDKTEILQYPIGSDRRSYVIPDSVKKITWGVFNGCTELRKLTIGRGITVIDDLCFGSCFNLQSIILPDNFKKIGHSAFKMTGLKNIDIPDSVEEIGEEAFSFCDNLENVNIGSGVKVIRSSCGLPNAAQITVSSDNKYFSSSDGVLYNKDKTKLVVYPGKSRKDIFSFPDSVEIIGANSIVTEKIKKIFIGKNVKKIESGNFLAYEEYGDYIYMASEIYYEGSREEWEAINAENETLSDLDENKIHFNSKRFAEPPTTTSVPPTTKRQSIFDLF